MGRQARLKALRREERQLAARFSGAKNDEPIRVLRAIHKTIQDICHENPRRCWEYLLELIAHSSGWQTDTTEAKHLWEPMANEGRWQEFLQSWYAEIEWAKRERAPFSEPLGQLLEEIEGTNDYLGQFFTPMTLVRVMNEITFDPDARPHPDGRPSQRGLDPACGTGRFILDALVHNEGLLMHGADLDLWLLRCAMLNVRLCAKWTSLRTSASREQLLLPLSTTDVTEQAQKYLGVHSGAEARGTDKGDLLVIGGRSIFMWGDSLVVDLNYIPNWLCAGWHWAPLPWQRTMKIDGYYGSYDQWVDAGRPPLHEPSPSKEVQFDYSMPEKQPRRRST